MSPLDKYVSRGYTSSLGESSGQWVAKSPESQQGQSFQPNNDGGTSFVLGGGVSQSRRKGPQPGGYNDPDYNLKVGDVMNSSTSGRRDIPSNCIGGRSSSSGTGSDGLDGQKVIMFVFVFGIAILLAGFTLGGFAKPVIDNNSWKNRPVRKGAHTRPASPSQPVWYR